VTRLFLAAVAAAARLVSLGARPAQGWRGFAVALAVSPQSDASILAPSQVPAPSPLYGTKIFRPQARRKKRVRAC